MADLATLAAVREYVGAKQGQYDSLLSLIVSGVSDRMEKYMRRTIAATTYTSEVHESVGYDAVVLDHGPVISVTTVIEGATTLTTADWRLDGGSLTRLVGTVRSGWAKGDVFVTYRAGYNLVPKSLELACVEQCAHEWQQTAAGDSRLGLAGKDTPAGDSESFAHTASGFVPNVIEAMLPYVSRF